MHSAKVKPHQLMHGHASSPLSSDENFTICSLHFAVFYLDVNVFPPRVVRAVRVCSWCCDHDCAHLCSVGYLPLSTE